MWVLIRLPELEGIMASRSRSLIASPLSSRPFVYPDRLLRGSRFSPRSALAAASSSPKRGLSNVHNGLVEVALCGHSPSRHSLRRSGLIASGG
jgi:hypothetical protein